MYMYTPLITVADVPVLTQPHITYNPLTPYQQEQERERLHWERQAHSNMIVSNFYQRSCDDYNRNMHAMNQQNIQAGYGRS